MTFLADRIKMSFFKCDSCRIIVIYLILVSNAKFWLKGHIWIENDTIQWKNENESFRFKKTHFGRK